VTWLSNFYERPKLPWVGFLLVLFFGPFGFLYHSWKTTIVVFFIVGPMWVIFLRDIVIDLVGNPWAHYPALVVLASYAWLEIAAKNQVARTPP
jgi:hypothetical protein